MNTQHNYAITVTWTGNTGEGTLGYRAYERSHSIIAQNKSAILGSSDPFFRGDKTMYNPEDLLVSSLSACHMLSYLHLCAAGGIIVTAYIDHATGTMVETSNGGGYFTEVTLNPIVTVTESSMIEHANELHKKANELCFIASSVKFPVHHKLTCNAVDR